MNNKKGFTLIEMLVVIVLIGIITAISFTSVRKIMDTNRTRKYNSHIKVVDNVVDLYISKNKGNLLSKNYDCFMLDYETLIEDYNLIEADVTCNGNIVLEKDNNISHENYLTCVDSGGNNLVKSKTVPSSCLEIR
jgi:prepilin-type N-terminal cleavage/methylation domain-containing protein